MTSFQDWLLNDFNHKLPEKVVEILKKEKIPEKWITQAAQIIHSLSEIPWITQEELANETSLEKEDLISLNKIIRESQFLQENIINNGLGKKYWNTIIPYTKSGYIQKVIEHEYVFPLTIALFPGLSCMFFCGFCGRNQTAAYNAGEVLESGIKRFKEIIKKLPENSTISIGGGLEPLTNSKLGELATFSKSLGHKVPMITNGYMLTPDYIKNNPGIWDLDSIRISLYGTDNESTFFVTRHKKAYEIVRKNIIEFLKLRNDKNSKVKLGMNFIIIPENMDNVLKLIDYIKDINSHVKNGKGVDFLTIREDFGSVTEIKDSSDLMKVKNRKYSLDGLMKKEHRQKLISIFEEFNKKKSNDCPDLYVDFGYAMDSLSKGVLGKPLAKVNGKRMRKSGYPQLCVTVDSLGDVFLFREAGFLNRPGNKKFIIGRISENNSFETILKNFIENKIIIDVDEEDSKFMDSYDHLMTLLVNQIENDIKFEVGVDDGPLQKRIPKFQEVQMDVNNNWYKE